MATQRLVGEPIIFDRRRRDGGAADKNQQLCACVCQWRCCCVASDDKWETKLINLEAERKPKPKTKIRAAGLKPKPLPKAKMTAIRAKTKRKTKMAPAKAKPTSKPRSRAVTQDAERPKRGRTPVGIHPHTAEDCQNHEEKNHHVDEGASFVFFVFRSLDARAAKL